MDRNPLYNAFTADKDKAIVTRLFAWLGAVLTFCMGVMALIDSNTQLAFVLLVCATLFAMSILVDKAQFIAIHKTLSVVLLLATLMCLLFYLVVTGGKSNTGPLWLFILPPVAMFLGGVYLGLVTIGVFTCILSITVFYPDGQLLLTSYDFAYKIRMLLSFLTVTFLSAFYEYSRQTTLERYRELGQQYELQARHDALTGLLNRRGIAQYLNHEVLRFHRSGKALSIVLADIDHFKAINDKYGHSAGDFVLVQIASVLSERLRKQDVIARWGGEEFLLLLPETSQQNAVELANTIRQLVAETPVAFEGENICLSMSFGVCEVNVQTSLSKALSKADDALYAAKENGRNRVERCA